MSRPEGVVDVGLGGSRQRIGELRVVRGLARVKAEILEQADAAGYERLQSCADLLADAICGERDRLTEQRAERFSDGSQGELGPNLSLGPTQMGHQKQPGASGGERSKGRHGGAKPRVVEYDSVLEGYIEVDANQCRDVLERVEIQVLEHNHLGHGQNPPRYSSRSAMRLAWPHSLSYQPTTRYSRWSTARVSGRSTIEE